MVGPGITRLILLGLILTIPPLPESARTILEIVQDDEPVFRADAGLDALLQNLNWSEVATHRLEPFDLRAIGDSPATYRGEPGVVSGRVLSQELLTLAGHDLVRWTVRPKEGPTFVVLLRPEQAARIPDASKRPSLEIPARFYKRYLRSRFEGDTNPVPFLLFVGTNPALTASQDLINDAGSIARSAVAIAVGVTTGLLIWILLRSRSRTRRSPARALQDDSGAGWNDANLPEEPADALAELRQRAEDASHE